MTPDLGAGQVRVVVEEAGAVHPLALVSGLPGPGSVRVVVEAARASWASPGLRELVLVQAAGCWRRWHDQAADNRDREIHGAVVFELWADLVGERVAIIRRPLERGRGVLVEEFEGWADRLDDHTAALHLGNTGALPVDLLLRLQARVKSRWECALAAHAAATDRVAA
ncbi:hypothetical protein [Glycomyces sp. MUSA5-2]|uniref:hypothetical protein n=1 Tax=Glycomyces sp. MUSA5-2 TaxID=2053002 RepID=UPI00300B57AC